jgi:hypothetical protein
MINNVRNTVLSLLNKENRGYITPAEFNVYADMAQLFLFENDFYDYSKSLVKQNNRIYNTEYSDIPKFLRERIDIFTKFINLNYNSSDKSFTYSETDVYKVLNLEHSDIDIEEVSKMDINRMKASSLNPTEKYPVYTKLEKSFYILPTTIINNVKCLCIRRPKAPKWTYTNVNGNPLFNPSASDYQDFEIHPSQEVDLIIKILGYAGLSITSEQVMATSKAEETYTDTKQQ